MIITTKAVVLHSRKFGDTSKIVNFYTLEDGLVTAIAKGSRSPKNKYGSSLDPMNCSEITYYRKPNRDLYLLSKSDLIKTYKSILTSYDKMIAGLAVLETVSLTQTHHEPNVNLYHLIVKTLDMMNKTEGTELSIFIKFLIEIASLLGFDLDFHFLNYLDEINQENIYLSIDNGEFVQSSSSQYRFRLRKSTAEHLQQINLMNWENPEIKNCSLSISSELRQMMTKYLSFHLDKHFVFRSFS